MQDQVAPGLPIGVNGVRERLRGDANRCAVVREAGPHRSGGVLRAGKTLLWNRHALRSIVPSF
jgi:hypothetical protein